ncbi:hypothetical protein [Nocardioides marmotae]|uniref:hypothetical protein n=1 Tax=Nocardioides marmotae TaxID=2663857 RepID=UPI0012B5B897|nr:hypothetical protein [Nocardioides marmotae]MBC9731781.1 hypothetical protein [Nocardioides marmotae]MTB82903.1 hypothetical protein [Nocardioides marmotae]
MSAPTPSPRRARHLLDPDNPSAPRPTRARARSRSTQKSMSIDTVQRYVLSVLAATTILHMSVGLVLAGLIIDDEHRVSQVGLCVLGGAFGVLAVAAALAIHRKNALSPWLLLGTIPGIVGVWLVLT